MASNKPDYPFHGYPLVTSINELWRNSPNTGDMIKLIEKGKNYKIKDWKLKVCLNTHWEIEVEEIKGVWFDVKYFEIAPMSTISTINTTTVL